MRDLLIEAKSYLFAMSERRPDSYEADLVRRIEETLAPGVAGEKK